jgi:hypothetical protein
MRGLVIVLSIYLRVFFFFSIDIPFKGSQSWSNIITEHRCSVFSRVRFPHKKTVFWIIRKDIRRYIRKVLTCVSGPQGKLFDEKNQRSKISCQDPFNYPATQPEKNTNKISISIYHSAWSRINIMRRWPLCQMAEFSVIYLKTGPTKFLSRKKWWQIF